MWPNPTQGSTGNGCPIVSILFYIFAPPLFFFTWFYILYIVYYLRILYFPQQNIPIQHTTIHLWVFHQILQRTCGFEGRKLEAEISSRKYIESLKEVFSRNSVNYFEVSKVVTSNCSARWRSVFLLSLEWIRVVISARSGRQSMHKTEDTECHTWAQETVNMSLGPFFRVVCHGGGGSGGGHWWPSYKYSSYKKTLV